MTCYRGTQKFVDRFDRKQDFLATGSATFPNGWTLRDTSAAGTPTATTTASGAELTLASNGEAEVLSLTQGDILFMPLGMLQRVWWIVSLSGIDAVTTVALGVGSGGNDTLDSITYNAWFRLEGSVSTSAIVAETDDNATDNDDKATGQTLGSTLKKFEIDFTNGLADVRFFIDGARVAATQTFSMAGAATTQGVQPYAQIQKASGNGTPKLTIREYGHVYNYADGA